MKKIIISGMLFLAIGMLSCNKEKVESVAGTKIENLDNQALLKSNDISPGEKHNEYLERYYISLKEELSSNENVTQQTFRTTFIDQIEGLEDNEEAKSYSKTLFNDILDADLEGNNFPDVMSKLEESNFFSSELKSFIVDFSLKTDEPNSVSEKNKLCESFIDKLETSISKITEQEVAYALIDIYDKSYDYWDENLDKWQNLIDPNGDMPTPSKTSIAGADFGGAVAGAVVGGVATGGPGAVPGAVIGAVGASVGAAAADLWDWFWS